MLQHERNQWFHRIEFMRAAQAVHQAAGRLTFMAAGMWQCKYIQLYVDQRTGDFIFRTSEGVALTAEEVYTLFPELRDNAVLVSAGVRPYPE